MPARLWVVAAVLQDKLLEEMWKQQDSLEGPAASETETSKAPEAGGGPEGSADGDSMLQRLRALEVGERARSFSLLTRCHLASFAASLQTFLAGLDKWTRLDSKELSDTETRRAEFEP